MSEAEVTPTRGPSVTRSVAGGFLMGLANLVPGVSGGTMILALGLYDRFIDSIAGLTRLRPSRASLVFLAFLGSGLVASVLLLSGPAVWSVTHHRWAAYSLFIGMTLGGVPNLLPVLRPLGAKEWIATLAGVLIMAGVAFGLRDTSLPHTFVVFTVLGAAAASSMILPGISGSYILLIFGLYDVVVGSLRPSALLEDWRGSLTILVPVGLGVVLGIGVLSNVLKVLLKRYAKLSHGVLLGLLLGSIFGLVPFQAAVHPELVTKQGVKGVELLLTGASLEEVEAEHGLELGEAQASELRERYAGLTRGELKLKGLELAYYRPGLVQVLASIGLLGLGVAITVSLGGRKRKA